jgi:hypothetical protein
MPDLCITQRHNPGIVVYTRPAHDPRTIQPVRSVSAVHSSNGDNNSPTLDNAPNRATTTPSQSQPSCTPSIYRRLAWQ